MVNRPDYILIKSKIVNGGGLELARSFSLDEGRGQSPLELSIKDAKLFLTGAEHVLSEGYGLYRRLSYNEFNESALESITNVQEPDLAYIDDKTGVTYRTTIYTSVTRLEKGK